MTQTIYTAGYSNIKDRDALLNAVRQQGWKLVDVRLSPSSRNPAWSGKQLREAFAGDYLHVREFGNLNYRGDYGSGIVLADPMKGCEIVTPILEKQSVVLLCVCGSPNGCHRSTVATALHEMTGLTVQHLTPSEIVKFGLGAAPTDDPTQLSLF